MPKDVRTLNMQPISYHKNFEIIYILKLTRTELKVLISTGYLQVRQVFTNTWM